MFEAHEESFKALVKRAETPVLGLLGPLLSPEAREAIHNDLLVTPSARAYVQRLDQYPALFGVWLAEHVMLGLGQDGRFSLYPHLQRAIGVQSELAPDDKELLWRGFRRAMFKLGIQPLSRVSGTHFMADEYVRQAGVPIAFADDLALRMLQLARRIGLPDEDDQEGLLTWQSALLGKLAPPFSVTACKAVSRDAVGYYTRAFVRVHLNGGRATCDDPLEQAMAKAFSSVNAAHIGRSSIPQLLYRDGALGVLFPSASRSTTYTVSCGGSASTARLEPEGGFFPLKSGLHRDVVVERDDGEKVLGVQLWPDHASNRLLIFNAEGRLRASAQLAQVDSVELPPGQYAALCRFEPSNFDWVDQVSDAPALFEIQLEIKPGSEIVLKNGPAAVVIVGQNQPSLSLSGPTKSSLERREFRYGTVEAHVEVPAEWLQDSGSRFELRVIHRDRREVIPFSVDEGRQAVVHLVDAIRRLGLPSGLWRLVVELGRVGEARAVQRQSFMFWAGLKAVSYGMTFSLDSVPRNLLASACSGFALGSDKISPSEEHRRLIRIAFDMGGGRPANFSWHRPGVFVEVQVAGPDGAIKSVPRQLGSSETVSLTSTKTIVVSASEPGGIYLGDRLLSSVDFSQKPSKAFPASFLASRLEPGARTLRYVTSSGAVAVDLLTLSQPHVASEIKTERLGNLFEIRLLVCGEPTDVSVTGKELCSGGEARAEHELMPGTWHSNDLARMQVYAAPEGQGHVVHVLMDVETLKPGMWTLGFGARIGGVWGRLQDADEGRIVVAFAVDELGNEIPGRLMPARAESLDQAEVARQLVRLNEHFRHCWSSVCWEQQKWLSPYFTALVDRLRDNESDYVTELIDAATCGPSTDGRPGYMSMQFAPASLIRCFCQHRMAYKRVNDRQHPLSIALKNMVALRGAVSPAFGTVLHPSTAMSFSNIAEIMSGRRPRGFSLSKYRAAVMQTSMEGAYQLEDEVFLPKAGELLGPLHLAHAWRDLERGHAFSHLMTNGRKSTALAVARSLARQRSNFEQSAAVGLRGQPLLMSQGRARDDQLDDTEQIQREQMDHIAVACAWLAWFCRLETRQPGALAAFHALLTTLRRQAETSTGTVTDCIAYFLQVAPAMFAYYLLLWELVQTIEFDPVVQNG